MIATTDVVLEERMISLIKYFDKFCAVLILRCFMSRTIGVVLVAVYEVLT